jgi:DNA polymerase-3 subunit alpha
LDRIEAPLLPPDINASNPVFTVEKNDDGKLGVRYALGAIRNVGRPAALAIVDSREKGPFQNLGDFSKRLDSTKINKRQIEALARAGAFDNLESNRACVFEGAEAIARAAQAAAEDRISNQSNLFGEADAGPNLRLPSVNSWSDAEQLSNELDAIGMYLSAHPLDAYQAQMKKLGVTSIADLLKNGPPPSTRRNQEYNNFHRGTEANCRIAATHLGRQERTSARGSRFAFVQLSDATGVIEATAFSEVLSSSRDLLDSGRPLLLGIEARLSDSGLRVGIASVRDLEEAAADAGRELIVHIGNKEALEPISSVLSNEKPGRATVRLLLEVDPAREISVELKHKISLSSATAQAMKSLPGVIDARME